MEERQPVPSGVVGIEQKPNVDKLITPNLQSLESTVSRYRQFVQPNDKLFDLTRVNEALTPFGLRAWSLATPDGEIIWADKIKAVTEANSAKIRGRHLLEESEIGADEKNGILTTAQKTQRSLRELEDSTEVQKFLRESFDKYDQYCLELHIHQAKDYREPLAEYDKVVELYRSEALEFIRKQAGEFYEDDKLQLSGLPIRKDQVNPGSDNYIPLAQAIIDLAKILPNQQIDEAYKGLLDRVGLQLPKFTFAGAPWRRPEDDPEIEAKANVQMAIDKVAEVFFWRKNPGDKSRSWDNLNPTIEESQRFYDVVEDQLFSTLYQRGWESWEGTGASTMFSHIRDPRAIPGLIYHLRRYEAGHTSANVASALSNIIKNSLTHEGLEEVISQAKPLDREIIEKWYKNPDPWVKIGFGGESHSQAYFVHNAPKHLRYGSLLEVARKVAEERGIEVDPGAIRGVFQGRFGEFFKTEQIENLLLENLDQVAQVFIDSKMFNWREVTPKLFHALVDSASGDYAHFPLLIASRGLGLTEEDLSKLKLLYRSRDLAKGIMARNIFVEGLLFLSSKDQGQGIMQSILRVTAGSKDDPSRIRQIFGLMQTLEGFGEFGFTPRDSLSEIIADLKEKLVVTAINKMQLGEEEAPYIRERFVELMESGIFEIVPALLAQYMASQKKRPAEVIREVGQHVIRADFKSWRESLDTSIAQLSALLPERQVAWTEPGKEVVVGINVRQGREARRGAVDAIRRIVSEAKAHVLEVYKLDFSEQRVNQLKLQQAELLRELKNPEGNSEQKKEFGEKKRYIDNEIRLLEGLARLETIDEADINPISIMDSVNKLVRSLESFQGLEQPASDLKQISDVLTTQQKLATVSRVRAYDTDDPLALLKAGTEPRETCQSWRQGSYNHCLPSYVVDANKRVINVEDENGEVVARSIAKLTKIKTNQGKEIPAILLEPIYATSEIAPIYRAVVKVALAKAQATGAVLVLRSKIETQTGTDHRTTVPIIAQEAASENMEMKQEDTQVYLPQSYNSDEYSDTLGGDITSFDRYIKMDGVVVVYPKAAKI